MECEKKYLRVVFPYNCLDCICLCYSLFFPSAVERLEWEIMTKKYQNFHLHSFFSLRVKVRSGILDVLDCGIINHFR